MDKTKELSVSQEPEAKPPAPRDKGNPGIVAAGGAMIGAGLGYGWPGAIVGGIIGLLAGIFVRNKPSSRQNSDSNV